MSVLVSTPPRAATITTPRSRFAEAGAPKLGLAGRGRRAGFPVQDEESDGGRAMRSDPGTRGAGVRDRSGFKDRGLPRNWREKWLSRLYLDYRDELRNC